MKIILIYFAINVVSITQLLADVALEPWTYTVNFEDRTLGAWASYPLWQDTAYDPNFRVNELVPGDPNICLVQKVTPYTNVDNYAGAQKLLDMYLTPKSSIRLRYYIKTSEDVEFFKVRFAAGEYGKLDVTVPNPKTNEWVWITVGLDDFVKENPNIKGKEAVKIYALAFLAKIPDADPDMPFYLGLDDITFEGERASAFQFKEPQMYKLPEFNPYIPKKHYSNQDIFTLNGQWPLNANRVQLEIVSYTDENKSFYSGMLRKKGDLWTLKPIKLAFPNGLYLGKLAAYNGSELLSDTEFTIHIAPDSKKMSGKHPRLLYDDIKKNWITGRLKENRFKEVYEDMLKNAKKQREKIPVESLVFDLDQFPEEDWLPTWRVWGSRIYDTADALRWNAMAYTFSNDLEAGNYAKNVLLKLSEWPNWTHPWQTKRGRFIEHHTGSWSHRVAEAYDLAFELMTPAEAKKIRDAIMSNIVEGTYKTYVFNDNITSKTSNWLAMITGGALMNMAAIYGDGPDTENLEPYFTGTMLKYYEFLKHVTDSKAGTWGEGYAYNSYSLSNLSYSIPSIKNVFNIDTSEPLIGTYNEYIWGGIIKNREWFEYGDSGGHLYPATNWAFLLNLYKEPRLGWYYNYLKNNETLQDVFYDTKNVAKDSPFDESPVKAFYDVGTTVFKSGWETDDFVFVMRTGAFYNHQHLDQGSFWLADRGDVFIEERHLENSNYYDDPLYQSWLTQPIAHSTILINGNHQSQRVGDPLRYAPGFKDHAFISQFLDGKEAAFSSGDIGKLYWGKVKSLTRNVLYLKPRTVLMVDIAIPAKEDCDVSLLYQTLKLGDIKAGRDISTISKENSTLNIVHLTPNAIESKAIETPHYLKTLLNEKPLVKEGMLTVTARTAGKPLVMANILTTTSSGDVPDVKSEVREGHIIGTASGKKFAFSTDPGNVYSIGTIKTDAVSMTWSENTTFVSAASIYSDNGNLILKSDTPMTFEISNQTIKYYRNREGEILLGSLTKPSSILLNGTMIKNYQYDKQKKTVSIKVPKGEGIIEIN